MIFSNLICEYNEIRFMLSIWARPKAIVLTKLYQYNRTFLLTLCNREDSGQRLDDSLQHDPAPVDRGHDLAGRPEVEGL